MNAVSNFHLPFEITCLAAFVDQKTNNSCAVIACQGKDPVEATAWLFTVFEVCRVENAAATGVQQTGFHDFRFGGVENKGNTCLARKARCDVIHIDSAVVAHVVDAHVEHVRTFANLFGCHLDARIPVFAQHCIAESFRAVCIGALTDDQETVVLLEGDRGVEGGNTWFEFGGAHLWCNATHCFDYLAKMFGRGSAATTNDADTKFGDMLQMELGQLWRSEVVMRLAIDNAW